jgi:predicted GTPase
MNDVVGTLKKYALAISTFTGKYYRVILFIFTLVLFSAAIFRINQLTLSEPSSDQVSEKVKTYNRPKIDQATIQKMQSLEQQNVEVKTLYENARSDPFVSE